jgi:predicted nucleic acid-binding protein
VIIITPGSAVYLDANSFIYTVEHIEPYQTQLDSVWQLVQNGQLRVLTSELTLLEVLVKPLRDQRRDIEDAFREVLQRSPDVHLLPITLRIIERAAHLRATTNLKTPNAIHAATALEHDASQLITNDPAFRRVPGLPMTLLSDLVVP